MNIREVELETGLSRANMRTKDFLLRRESATVTVIILTRTSRC